MHVTLVKYTLRQVLAQYEHEELTVELASDPERPEDGLELMKEARRICICNTTKYLNKEKKDGNK